MKSKYIVKKQLATLPCKFILGVIGRSDRLIPNVDSSLIDSTKRFMGEVEQVMPVQSFLDPPRSYVEEMGTDDLSTTILVLRNGGSYNDLYHLKKETERLEKEFLSEKGRIFNVNPGAVGTFGICLASHKDSKGRDDISMYAYGFHPHFLFGPSYYYERIMGWDGRGLRLVGKAATEGKFPEYSGLGRVEGFEGLVRNLSGSDRGVELMVGL